MSQYESQANQLTVNNLTNWTATANNLPAYIYNTQAADTQQSATSLLAAQGAANSAMAHNLQGHINSHATLQESINANFYIADVLETQDSSLDLQNNTIRQQQFKLRDEIMHAEYLQRYYETATSVLILSMIVILVLLIPAALWRIGQMSFIVFSAIVLVVILVYLCLMVYVSSTTSRRRRDSWHQMEWALKLS